MSLNTQGIISVVVLVLYVPILFLAIRICTKYGVRERAWLLLVIFSILRIVGGGLLIAAELVTPVITFLYTLGYAFEASGLSPLLLSTLGLLEIIVQGPEKDGKRGNVFRILHIVGLLALALTILGITKPTSSGANTERRAGVILFAALYIVLIGVIVMLWARSQRLMKARKQLLLAVSVALPFLAVRVLYSVLSMFSSSSFTMSTGSSTDSNSALAKFNMFTGEWQLYVLMEVVMEYIIVIIYTSAGIMLRLGDDYKLPQNDEYPLYPPQY